MIRAGFTAVALCVFISSAASTPGLQAQAATAPRSAATPHERLAREIYAELVGTNTTDSTGSTTRAARKLERRFLDAAYALNEGGGGTLRRDGDDVRPVLNAIQAAEKVSRHFTLTVRNIGGHSSVPRADNAIYSLANGLVRRAKLTFPVAINPVTRAYFEQTAKVEGGEFAAAMRAIAENPNDAAAAATLSKDPR